MSGQVSDGLAFNDADGWGFCEYCAYSVAVAEGLRVDHRYASIGNNASLCPGSGKPPQPETPYAAKALDIVSLWKLPTRVSSRSYWRALRQTRREKIRKELFDG